VLLDSLIDCRWALYDCLSLHICFKSYFIVSCVDSNNYGLQFWWILSADFAILGRNCPHKQFCFSCGHNDSFNLCEIITKSWWLDFFHVRYIWFWIVKSSLLSSVPQIIYLVLIHKVELNNNSYWEWVNEPLEASVNNFFYTFLDFLLNSESNVHEEF